jgi:hypothetical protein
MERGSSKHARWMDDRLANEVRELRGNTGGGRLAEWREPEPAAPDQPDASAMNNDVREARSRLGRYVPRTVFPANRQQIVAAAEHGLAPDDLIAQLSSLDGRRTFQNVAQIWASLGYGQDERF